jgi:hypothetical protein
MLGKADSHVLYWNQACARQTEALIPVKPAGQGLYLPQTFPLIWLPQCPMENWKKDVLNSFALWFFSNQCCMHITFLNAKARQEFGKKRKAGT